MTNISHRKAFSGVLFKNGTCKNLSRKKVTFVQKSAITVSRTAPSAIRTVKLQPKSVLSQTGNVKSIPNTRAQANGLHILVNIIEEAKFTTHGCNKPFRDLFLRDRDTNIAKSRGARREVKIRYRLQSQ